MVDFHHIIASEHHLHELVKFIIIGGPDKSFTKKKAFEEKYRGKKERNKIFLF